MLQSAGVAIKFNGTLQVYGDVLAWFALFESNRKPNATLDPSLITPCSHDGKVTCVFSVGAMFDRKAASFVT